MGMQDNTDAAGYPVFRPKRKQPASWITWFNIHSGNRTTRAHIASTYLAGRTKCGWTISTLVSPAPRALLRCKGCLAAEKKGEP